MHYSLQLHGNLDIDAYPVLTRRAEQLGFADLTIHDVLLRRPVWPVLCDVARASEQLLIGPNVTHPHLQHPAVIAANIAHLDELSGGRAVVGIGRGSLYEIVGRTLPRGYESLAEAVAVIRALLRGETAGVDGETFSLAPNQAFTFGEPRDVPVFLGVYGRKGAELAGQIADGVRSAAQWDPAWMTQFRGWLAESAERAGRDPDSVELTVENWTYLHPDRDLARTAARRLLCNFLPYLGTMLEFYKIPDQEVDAARAVTLDGQLDRVDEISDSTVDRFMAAGDADDLRRGLDNWEAAGFSTVSFSGALGPDTDLALDMIGAEIERRTTNNTTNTTTNTGEANS
jgi:5,10-methylenetetrahydromethanopterin reductase